jgi:hypothetical protein
MNFTKEEALKDLHTLRLAVCNMLDYGVNEELETELELALEDVYDGIHAIDTRSEEVLTREERLMVHCIVQRAHDVLS